MMKTLPLQSLDILLSELGDDHTLWHTRALDCSEILCILPGSPSLHANYTIAWFCLQLQCARIPCTVFSYWICLS